MMTDKRYALFPAICHGFGLPRPEPEWKFMTTRRFRFDFAWVQQKVALEINGGVYLKRKDGSTGGRHNTGSGFIRDMDKLNHAQLHGWIVLQFQPADLNKTATLDMIRSALEIRGFVRSDDPIWQNANIGR